MDKIELQRDEFNMADAFAKALKSHNMTSVVDDDYPEVRWHYENALANFIDAMRANGRFDGVNRYGLASTRVPGKLEVSGHPKEEFDKFLQRVGAQVPLDDGNYDLSLAFTVQSTGYLLTHANLQRVPESSQTRCITHYIRDLAREFKENTGKWPNTVLLGADNYEELRRACPHGSAIAWPGMDELGTQVTLRIVRVRTPNELRVGLV